MPEAKKYVSSLLNKNLLFMQERLYAKYYLQFGAEDASTFILANNLFEEDSEEVSLQLIKEVKERVTVLGEEGLRLLLSSGTCFYEKKLLVLYSLVYHDYLFLDFMSEVYGPSLDLGELNRISVTEFFKTKSAECEKMKNWGVSTFKTLGCKYLSILQDVGIIVRKNRDAYSTVPVCMSESLVKYFSSCEAGSVFVELFR